ncbi:MAG: hypothetical protein K8R49_08050, partial [Candidatus Cloacimonetes bacterium]|nr:hypothetical protein [Candidatus Cloacimonadota bacterium]
MKKLNFVILILVCILAVNTLSARYKDIPVTRDLNPNQKYKTFEEYKQDHPFKPTRCSEINRVISDDRDENFLIIVNSNLYPQITSSIATYQNDLANEGFNSFLVEFDGTSILDLKCYLMIYYQEEDIKGVALIGDLPVAWFEMFEDFNNNGIWDPDENWVDFPIELYFSDINGIWEDQDSNGIFDYHEGDKHPEIGIGRIKADNMNYLSSSEAELVNSYFQKNHLYRNGFLQNTGEALTYIDDDWSYWGPEYQAAMQLLYPETVLVHDINQTTADDYRMNRLSAEYEFIQVHVHSGPDAHHFCEDNGNTWNLVTSYQISYLNPTSFFYNLFACSNSRFTESNNMGGMYLFGNGYCVGTIGSTKTGSMLWFEDFYGPLSLDGTMGEALRQWWALSVDVGNDWMWQRSWFYGMAIQGDPSLKIHYLEGNIVNVPQDYPTIQQAIDAVENGDLVLVDPGTYVENVNYNGKNITVASLFLTTQDTIYISSTIIDGNQNGSVVTFESGEDSTAVLCGFTITNGLAPYNGGGIKINGSPLIENCIIQNNSATRGGGIYITGSPIIRNNIIQSNTVTVAGGGIISYCGEMVIRNNLISQNHSDIYGGGIHVEISGFVEIANNRISANSSHRGGAICFHAENAGGIIKNNLVIENIADYIYLDFDYQTESLELINNTFAYNVVDSLGICIYNAVLINNILWENADEEIISSNVAVRYCNIQGGWEGEGNIDEDPCFINPDIGLYTLSMYSPCIGAGIDEIEIGGTWYYAPLSDIEGSPRPNPAGSMPDMGAYESFLGEPQVGITQNQLPKTDHQLSNYPNPFNPSTTISFSLTTEDTESTELVIYNLKGQKIKTFPVIL